MLAFGARVLAAEIIEIEWKDILGAGGVGKIKLLYIDEEFIVKLPSENTSNKILQMQFRREKCIHAIHT